MPVQYAGAGIKVKDEDGAGRGAPGRLEIQKMLLYFLPILPIDRHASSRRNRPEPVFD